MGGTQGGRRTSSRVDAERCGARHAQHRKSRHAASSCGQESVASSAWLRMLWARGLISGQNSRMRRPTASLPTCTALSPVTQIRGTRVSCVNQSTANRLAHVSQSFIGT